MPDSFDGLATGSVLERAVLSPTARPHQPSEQLDGEGLYVLRFFDVEPAHHAEFVEVSTAAWETFENTDTFAARAMGLFTAADDSSTSPERMLLVTWYDGFGSWTASRTPDPAAQEAFAHRQRLTTGTIAFATTLVRHG